MMQRMLAVSEPEGSVVTLTLDVSGSGILPPATRVFLKNIVENHLGSKARSREVQTLLAGTAARIRRFVSDGLKPETDGLFLVAGRTVWETVELKIPLRNFVHTGPVPFLAPLLDAQGRSPRAYAAIVSERGAEIREHEAGRWTPRFFLEPRLPEQDAAGINRGSRERFRHAAAEAFAATIRGAAGHLRASSEPVLAFGSREMHAALRDELPRGREVQLVATDFDPAAARGALEQIVRRGREDEIRLFQEHRAEGHAVALGPREVLEHVASIARVFVDPYDPVPGMRCASCAMRYPGLKARCDFCTGELVPVSMTAEVVHHAMTHPGVGLTFVGPQARWLEDLGGMAALLRRPQ